MGDGSGLTIRIRRANVADAPVLTAIAHVSKRHWRYDESLLELWRDDLTVAPRHIESHLVRCAEADGEIRGFYSLSDDGHVWEIEHMWVLPGYIGSGIGRALFRDMMDELRANGATTLRIASDPNAEGFYLAMGARRIGEIASTPPGRAIPLLELTIEKAVRSN